MRCVVVYSSVTGNTRAVAEAVLSGMPEGTELYPVDTAPPPDDYDFLALGFWVSRAAPDPKMLRYMGQVRGKTVGLFGTLAAYPDSPHAAKVVENAAQYLEGNRVACTFLCQGRLSPARMKLKREAASGGGYAKTHPMTPERLKRLEEAALHPDENDFAAARRMFADFFGSVRR